MLDEVLATNRFYRRKLSGLRAEAAYDELPAIPFTTRREIEQDQIDYPPYGTNLTYALNQYRRLHQTSGSTGRPLRWLDTPESWAWWKRCWEKVYRAAGLTEVDRLLFPFSFGPFIGFWAAFEGAVALGNLSLAAGGMTSAARLRFMLDNEVTVVCCTPTYALRLAEVAREQGIDLPKTAVRALIVAGEPGGSLPGTRERIERAWGARVFDHTGMTEMGAVGFECEAQPGGMHLIESEYIPEVINSETGEPVPEGDAGELVLTNLGRWGSPLIRYRTGDLARIRRGRCACGRWSGRLEGGIMGRIDDMLVIRGNNVYPSVVEAIILRFPAVAEFRLEPSRLGATAGLRIAIEPIPDADGPALAAKITEQIRNELNFRPEVVLADSGALPRFEMKARRVVYRDGSNQA
jgi:phenylacetate-CoA ligase